VSDDEFWELAAAMEGSLRGEREAEVAAILAAARAAASLRDLLRETPAGDVITIVTLDGAAMRGRVLSVGSDVVSLGEVVDDVGVARVRIVRVHDIALSAVVRVVREAWT
jgi:hypothetical protein